MAQKPKSDTTSEPSSSVVFARFGSNRPKMPSAVLPLPVAVASAMVEMPPARDLSGKRKVLFFIGRGKTGKSTLVRYLSERMDEQGGTAIVAAADPSNRSLRTFRDNVAEPDSDDPAEVRDWLADLLQHVMDNQLNAIIDLGGGNTTLSALLKTMPDLATVLAKHGVEPVAIYMVGADEHDLVPLAMMEAIGFKPAATAIVCNEKEGTKRRFEQVLQHPTFLAAIERGAVPLWMPELSRDAVEQCDGYHWRYHDAPDKAGPFVGSAVRTWLRRMAENLAPITSWIPDA